MNWRLWLWLVALALTACGGDSHSSQPLRRLNQPAATSTGPIVFMGDSITMLWPLQEFVPDAINAGISGNETGQMRARFETDVLALHPSILVLLGGTNDIRNRDSADAENLFAMVRLAKDAGIRVIVGTLPPADINLGSYPEVERKLFAVMNDKIAKAAAKYGYDVADYYGAMTLADGSLDTYKYADRYLHPNRAGYEAMWLALQPVLTQLAH